MPKICDHTSVGMMVWKDDKLLLIERGKQPFGFAIPAGHVDGDKTFGEAALRELKEEVGLEGAKLELLAEERKENPCRREGGTWHHWKIYKVQVTGSLQRSLEETKKAGWYTLAEIGQLGERTEKYLGGHISEQEWEKNPGLEVVMYHWFKQLKVI